MIVAKKYDNSLTEPEKQAIKKRLFFLEGYTNVLVWKELPIPSFVSYSLLKEKIVPIIKSLDHFYFIVDKSEQIKDPTLRERKVMRDIAMNFSNLKHLIFVGNKRKLLPIIVKFIVTRRISDSAKYVKTWDEAILFLESIYE